MNDVSNFFSFSVFQGRTICGGNPTTFRPSTLWIWKNSERIEWATFCVPNTMPCRQIRVAWQIWTRIYPTMPNTRFQFSRFHRNGFGVNRGVRTKPRPIPKPSIYAIIRCTRNPKFPWPRYVQLFRQ